MDLKFRYKIIIVFLFLLLFPLTKFGSFINFGHSYRDEWLPCVEYLGKDRLYVYEKDDPVTAVYEDFQGGCAQSPALFYFIYPLYKIFWYSAYFIPVMYIVSFLLSFFIFLFLIMIIKKETGKYYILLTLILYILLILINLPANLEMLLSILFLFIGVYVLFYANYKYKEYLAGLFFVLSVYSKISTLFFILFLLPFYYLYVSKWNIKNLLSYKTSILRLVLSSFLTTVLFWLLQPGYFNYIFVSTIWLSEEYSFTIFVLLSSLYNLYAETGIYAFIIIFSILISFFIFLRKRTFYSFLTSFGSLYFMGFLVYALSYKRGVFEMTNFIYSNKFMIAFIFFIITFVIWYSKVSKNKKSYDYLLFLICLIIILVPALKGAYLIGATNNFMKEISYLPEIPKQEGDILMDSHGVYPELDKTADQIIFGYLFTTPQREDDYKKRGYNLTLLKEKRLKELEPYINKLNNKEYSLIITKQGPYSDIYQIVKLFNLLIPDCHFQTRHISDYVQKSLDYRSFFVFVYNFKDAEQCSFIRNEVVNYYSSKFDDICKKDRIIANTVIKSVFFDNRVYFARECGSNSTLIFEYAEFKLGYKEAIFILILISIIFLYYRIHSYKYNYKENFDYITMVLMLLIFGLIVLSIIIPLENNQKIFPHERSIYFSYQLTRNSNLYNAGACLLNSEGSYSYLSVGDEIGYLCYDDDDCKKILQVKGLKLNANQSIACMVPLNKIGGK